MFLAFYQQDDKTTPASTPQKHHLVIRTLDGANNQSGDTRNAKQVLQLVCLFVCLLVVCNFLSKRSTTSVETSQL